MLIAVLRSSVVVLAAVALAACGGAAQPSPADQSTSGAPASGASAFGLLTPRPLGSVVGAPLGYLEHLPSGYGDGVARPLLVFLHGTAEAGDGSEAALRLVAALDRSDIDLGLPPMIGRGDWPAERPFVVLAPQYGTEAASGECDLADELAAFIEFALDQYEVDPSRVYLTGISCGAIGVWDYLAVHGDEVVAAAVPISGHAEWALEKAGCAPLAAAPVWAFHGAQDEDVPVVHIEGPVGQIRDCAGVDGTEVELTVYPDAGHDAWTRTYDLSAGHDIYAWMLAHANPRQS